MKSWIAEATDVPGDGTCMFHSIGLPLNVSGHYLRKIVVSFIEQYPDSHLHGETMRNWILWDQSVSLETYVSRLKQGQWGGSIETTLLASMLKIPIFVYEPKGTMCTRIAESRPDKSIPSLKIITDVKFLCLLYVGKNHYMSLKASFE
jgi:hypothetical protein